MSSSPSSPTPGARPGAVSPTEADAKLHSTIFGGIPTYYGVGWAHTREERIVLIAQHREAAVRAAIEPYQEWVRRLRDALEKAPSPVCVDEGAGKPYDYPHRVRNFADIDRWWVLARSHALDLTLSDCATSVSATSTSS